MQQITHHSNIHLLLYKHFFPQVYSPDGWWFRSFYFQIIRLFLHLKLREHQRDSVARIRQYGPLTLPAAAQTSSTYASASRVAAGEIKARDEPAGAPQGATACVFRCQSQHKKKKKNRVRRWKRKRQMYSMLFQTSCWKGEKVMSTSVKHLQLSIQINADKKKKH